MALHVQMAKTTARTRNVCFIADLNLCSVSHAARHSRASIERESHVETSQLAKSSSQQK
jgi:hypothetical protein